MTITHANNTLPIRIEGDSRLSGVVVEATP
jgi:hypothetical protein